MAVLCWWGPALLAGPFTLTHHLGEPHPQLHPLWEWLGQPVFGKAALFGVVFLAIVAVLRCCRPGPVRLRTTPRPVD